MDSETENCHHHAVKTFRRHRCSVARSGTSVGPDREGKALLQQHRPWPGPHSNSAAIST